MASVAARNWLQFAGHGVTAKALSFDDFFRFAHNANYKSKSGLAVIASAFAAIGDSLRCVFDLFLAVFLVALMSFALGCVTGVLAARSSNEQPGIHPPERD